MKRFRTILFWCHLTAGISAGLVIFVMSVTGALLAFEPQILKVIEQHVRHVRPPRTDADRIGVERMLSAAAQFKPDAQATAVTIEVLVSTGLTLALRRFFGWRRLKRFLTRSWTADADVELTEDVA